MPRPEDFGVPATHKDYGATDPNEVFADYGSYLLTDTWPSSNGADVWVGDMPPQHAASAIWKLMRWSKGAWADEMRGEQEWAAIRETPLYKHLAARATANDFVDAMEMSVQLAGTPLDRKQASIVLLHLLVEQIEMPTDRAGAEHLGAAATAMAEQLYDRGYVLEKT